MSKICARCDKSVYPTEELKCLDKVNILSTCQFTILQCLRHQANQCVCVCVSVCVSRARNGFHDVAFGRVLESLNRTLK